MAMDGDTLATALAPVIKSKIEAVFEIISGVGETELQKFATALAEAIGPAVVNHIKSNAVVPLGIAVQVNTGTGTGATTGTGTVT